MVKAIEIYKSYGQLSILKGINLDIDEGEVISVVGASGAGKSTLLHILGTLDKPDAGDLRIQNCRVFNLSSKHLSAFRNQHIGFVFQFHHLLPEFTALENVCIPAYIAKQQKKEAIKRGMDLLDLLNLAHRASHKPSQLSGGEQQRVAVARALMNNPSLVLADEPSGNLDANNARELHQLFFRLREKLNQTFVIVTHNQELAKMADRMLTIKDGQIVDD